jgi:hypothetical protein
VSQSTAKTDQAKVQEAREKGSDINNWRSNSDNNNVSWGYKSWSLHVIGQPSETWKLTLSPSIVIYKKLSTNMLWVHSQK